MKLQAESISVHYGDQIILDRVSMSTERGQLIGLIGPNGAGKSTLLRVLAGLVTPSGGEVRLDGTNLANVPAKERAQKLSFMPQDHVIHWPISVHDIVAMGRLPYRQPLSPLDRQSRNAITSALETMSLIELQDRSALELSGGELARVLLARALAQTPDVLLADEPTAGLDPAHKLHLLKHLSTISKAGMSIILVLHDLTLAARFCDHLVLLDKGRLYAEGPPSDVLTHEALRHVYHIRASIAENEGLLTITPLDGSEPAL